MCPPPPQAGIVKPAALIGALAIGVAAWLVSTSPGTTGATSANASASGSEAPAGRARRVGPVPVVRQVFRNNCETAALSMILAAVGRPVDQRALQQAVAKSGPLDPIVASDGTWVWGDPDRGFVGRAAGGGTAGGFGVYQGPIRRLAAAHGVALADLSRRPVEDIYARVARGRPVMAWVGLSEGPYRRWSTPAGKTVGVNFGEHTVVLVGMRGTGLLVNDPLVGERVVWSRATFERRWSLLGERALGL